MGRSRAKFVEKEGRLQTQLKKYIELSESFAVGVAELELIAKHMNCLFIFIFILCFHIIAVMFGNDPNRSFEDGLTLKSAATLSTLPFMEYSVCACLS